MSGRIGPQCSFVAGANGFCGKHGPDHKFGFYDEPRPTLWGVSHDGRRLPLPPSEEKQRGKPISWKKNVILPPIPSLAPSRHHLQSHIRCQRTQIEELKKQLEETKRDFEIEKEKLQSTVKNQKDTLQNLHMKLSRIVGNNPSHRNTHAAVVECLKDIPRCVSEYKILFDHLGIDTEKIKGGKRQYKQAYEDYLKKQQEGGDDELQEDKNSYDEIAFEGVSYLEDEETGKIYNLKHQYVGKWNTDFDDIIWVSEEFKKQHETLRDTPHQSLKQPEEDKSTEDEDEFEDANSYYEKTTFEGVLYFEDEDTDKIYNSTYHEVGKWNSDYDDIIWNSEEFRVEHRYRYLFAML